MRGHASCVEFVKSFNLPLLLLGGGGYTMRNVSRAWAYETGLAAGQELSSQVPVNEYYEYFGPDYKLDVRPNNMEDLNTREYLEKIKVQLFENLRHTTFAPSVQGHVPPGVPGEEEMDEEEELLREGDDAMDVRASKDQRRRDRRVQKNGELSDSEDEGEGGRRDRRDHGEGGSRNGSSPRSRPSIMEPLRRRQEEAAKAAAANAAGNGDEAAPPSSSSSSADPVAAAASAGAGPGAPLGQALANQAAKQTEAAAARAEGDGSGDVEMAD